MAVLTGLPLFWGEGGFGTAADEPGWRAATLGIDAVPIDVASAATLAPHRLLIAAQPRDQAPADLVALDRWVRRGGRLLWLADPDLRRASRYPPGDPREPPRGLTLRALLAHWRIAIAPDGTVAAPACRPLFDGAGADCVIGAGRVLLLADADGLESDAGDPRIGALVARLAQSRTPPRDSRGISWYGLAIGLLGIGTIGGFAWFLRRRSR